MAEPSPLRHGGEAWDPARANNLDLLRLAAALLVLFSHVFALTGHADDEPVAKVLRHVTDGGGLAVGAFFVLSGFLIARSAQRLGWRAYLRARALRIFPAFAVVVVAQTLVLGAAVSALGPRLYLTDPAVWVALFRALLFSPRPGLPGVFEVNPLPGVVNGSLWTLRIEVLCYLAALVWAVLGGRRWMMGAGLAAAGAAVVAGQWAGAGLRVTSVLDCLWFFAAGSAIWCWRGSLPLRWWIAAVLAVVLALTLGTAAGPAMWRLALPYLVLRLGLTRPVLAGPMRGLGDVSYGVYLYAFPVGQMVALLVPGIGPYGLALVSLGPTALCALASSRLVERPALARRRPPAPSPLRSPA